MDWSMLQVVTVVPVGTRLPLRLVAQEGHIISGLVVLIIKIRTIILFCLLIMRPEVLQLRMNL